LLVARENQTLFAFFTGNWQLATNK
jgi:hypothetical protein